MTTNFSTPYFSFEAATPVVPDDSVVDFPLSNDITILENYYGTGYVQVFHQLILRSTVAPLANIGSVVEESTTRRELGYWHREQDGAVDSAHVIEYPVQRFVWRGETYPFERSNAADPGLIVLRDGIFLDFTLDQNALIKVEPASLTLLAIPNPAAANNNTQPQFIYRRPVPQYYIDKGCFRLKPDNDRITMNFFQPNNYKTLGKLKLYFDSDKVVIRSRPGVTIQAEYNSFVIIASESSLSKEYIGGNAFGVCVPLLPVYPPEEPAQVVQTSP